MVNSARMLKTLGCLVAAMIGTNALLGAIDPSMPPPNTELEAGQLRALADVVVREGVDVQERRWDRIELLGGGAPTGRMLAARGSDRAAHFVIDILGRPVRTARWREQAPSHAAPGAIQVEVTGWADQRSATKNQIDGLRALVHSLRSVTGRENEVLPVIEAGTREPVVGL